MTKPNNSEYWENVYSSRSRRTRLQQRITATRKFRSWLGFMLTPSALAAAGVFIIASIALFVPPYVGMADNGDYFRILYSNGIYFNDPDYDNKYLGYFVKQYGIMQYFNENGATISSSQSLLIQLAAAVNGLFNSQIFDLRVQAGILLLLYTIAVYLLVEALTWKRSKRSGFLIAAAAIFVLGDSAYIAFFNSFYSESMVLISLVLLLAAGLLLYRNRYNDYALLALFVSSGLILTTSKQQNAPAGVIIAVAGLALLLARRSRAYRSITIGSLILLMLAGAATYWLIPETFVNINKYHAMTRGVLMQSDNPEATLTRMGINKQYALLNESIYYEPYTTIDVNGEEMTEQFYSRYGFGSVLLHYLTHPGDAARMLELAAKQAFTNRPPAMGNYEQEAGREFGAHTRYFSLYSDLKQWGAPKTFGFVVLWIVLVIGLYIPSFIKGFKEKRPRLTIRLAVVTMMVLLGLSGMLVSIIGAGDADLSKHEFVFTAVFDIVTLAAAADLLSGSLWMRPSKPSNRLNRSKPLKPAQIVDAPALKQNAGGVA